MGDHRLNVEIKLTGADGNQKKLDWWVNWWPDKAEILYKELVQLAIKSGLQVEDKTYLFDADEDTELQRLRAENEALKRDKERLDYIQSNTVDLRCVDMPTGGDDYDIHWIVIEHHMAKPTEREIGRGYNEFAMREAIDRAMKG